MARAFVRLAIAVLLLAPAGSADWLQEGGDAAQSGNVPGGIPDWPDVAWVAQVPGSNVAPGSGFTGSLIVGAHVYAVTADRGERPELNANATFRLDLETGAWVRIIDLEAAPLTFASDGERLFFPLPTREIVAYSLEGAELWRQPMPPRPADAEPTDRLPPLDRFDVSALPRTICAVPSVSEGLLRLACSYLGRQPASWAAALDTTTGETRWRWWKSGVDEITRPGSNDLPVPPIGDPAGALGQESPPFYSLSGSVFGRIVTFGDHALVMAQEYLGTSGAFEVSVWALSDGDGQLAWTRNASFATRRTQSDPNEGLVLFNGIGLPVGDEGAVYVRFENLYAYNPVRGNVLWARPIGEEDTQRTETLGSTGSALTPDALFTSSYQTVYRFDRIDGREIWHHPILGNGTVAGSSLLHSQGKLLVPIQYITDTRFAAEQSPPLQGEGEGRRTFLVLDAQSGALVWRLDVELTEGPLPVEWHHAMFTPSLSEGKLVIAGADGSVRLIGRTSASMTARADVSDTYPHAGERIEVDLAKSGAGLQGAPTRFRAHWGDGSSSEWQNGSRFEHVYDADGEYVARFEAANEAGQTSSTTATMSVGGTPPTLLEIWFSAERQETSFFVLGLLLTLLGVLWGLARVRRRRRILARELRDADAAYEATKARPLECDAALAERKARARGLLLAHKLTEAEFAMIERRIDELALSRRVEVVDAELAFLPHSLHEFLREMLADGRISRWEREHFVQALDRDTLLTREQKAQVLARVDAWLARDAGR